MSKVKFDLNLSGLNQLMKGAEIQAVLTQTGSRVLSNAKSSAQDPEAEYGMNTRVLNFIAVTNVRAENGAAINENYKNNTLLKALR